MTTYTDHGLACLDDGDYAAIALALQVDALAIDAALDGISDAFDSYATRPYMIGVTTVTQGPFLSSSEALIGIGGWSTLSTNMTVSAATYGRRIVPPESGWYSYGAYTNMVASGGVTAGSRRTLFARATLRAPGSSTILDQTPWRTVDTNTGGEFLVASGGEFYATANTTIDIEAYFTHANVASGMNIVAPARLWCHFAGSGVEIGSA